MLLLLQVPSLPGSKGAESSECEEEGALRQEHDPLHRLHTTVFAAGSAREHTAVRHGMLIAAARAASAKVAIRAHCQVHPSLGYIAPRASSLVRTVEAAVDVLQFHHASGLHLQLAGQALGSPFGALTARPARHVQNLCVPWPACQAAEIMQLFEIHRPCAQRAKEGGPCGGIRIERASGGARAIHHVFERKITC